jgi:hypothetical protein
MNVPFERLLVRPTADRLVAVLCEAARATGQVALAQLLSEEFWRDLLAKADARPQGRFQWAQEGPERYSASGFVGLAWWTDPQGGRHWRVCGGDDTHRHFLRAPEEPRPPLWHVYPDRLFRRTREGQSAWLAACDCGACGPPEALAWMGPYCGPCHDRREEALVPLPAPAPRTFDFSPRPVQAVAFAPDGSALAVAREGGPLDYLDLRTGEARELCVAADRAGFPCLAFSPDGRLLAAADPAKTGVLLLTLEGEEAGLLRWSWADPEVRGLAFAPDGRTLAACGGEGAEVWRNGPECRWSREPLRSTPTARSLAYSPDGRTLAVGTSLGRVQLLDTGSWRERADFDTGARRHEAVLFLDFTPDGRRLVLLTGSADPVPGQRSGMQARAWDLGRGLELRCGELPYVSTAALSPDGRYLASVVHDEQHSPAAVAFWEVASGRECCALEWDPEDLVRCLDFAADGRTLVTGSQKGTLTLWPWRELLEA